MNFFTPVGKRFIQDCAFRGGKKSIVPSAAYIPARMDFRSVLTDNNVAADDVFAAIFLDTKPLSLAVTTVAG